MPEGDWILRLPLEAFDDGLRRTGRGIFLLDYDGTLAPFRQDVSQVVPYPGVVEALDAILDTGRARVAVITGRFLKAAPPLLPTRNPVEVWGSHGRERRWADGRYAVVGIDEAALRALNLADSWADAVSALGGRAEPKPGSLAFHWRGVPEAGASAIRQLLGRRFEEAGLEQWLEPLRFDGGMEFRVRGRNKGDVVREILAEESAQVPVSYLGDDLTDEDAFEALRGHGLGVLVRPQCRTTAAQLWVQPPDGLLGLLGRWHQCLMTGRLP